MENPEFLKQKYQDLNKSREVGLAARRTKARTGRELPMMVANDRIQNYMDRLKEIFENPDVAKRERGIEFLKHKLHEQFVIRPEEIPEAYFESIKRKHKEEGYGDIEIPEDYRNELSDTIITDQTRSLDNWIDYLSSDDAKYPDWLKYFTVRSMLRMGRYDKKKKSFTERTGGTTAPFPDLNREALAIVLESFEQQAKSESPKFGYDIQEDTKKQFLEFLGKKNFAKLYALVVEEFKPIAEELLQITKGEWRTYPRGSDPKPLVESIAPYGTGWCLRGESMAKRYLVRDKNELQVFYSLDKEGKPTVPRVVTVVNANNQLTEVRGVAPEENLDQYIGDIVQNKLKEFSDGKLYKKKTSDMKFLTEIDNKVKKGEKLSKEELIFIYEINDSIQGFGYQKDPRIEELRRRRNIKEDQLIIFECKKEQIAYNINEINKNTKAYIGEWNPEIMKKLPENIEYLYESFPEKKILRKTIELTTKTPEEYTRELLSQGHKTYEYAQDMLNKIEPLKQKEKIGLVSFSVKQLGFSNGATLQEIYNKAKEFGLELCPPQVGPELRLNYKDQPNGEWLRIAMEPISDRGGFLGLFGVDRFDSGSWLGGGVGRLVGHWGGDCRFVFRFRK